MRMLRRAAIATDSSSRLHLLSTLHAVASVESHAQSSSDIPERWPTPRTTVAGRTMPLLRYAGRSQPAVGMRANGRRPGPPTPASGTALPERDGPQHTALSPHLRGGLRLPLHDRGRDLWQWPMVLGGSHGCGDRAAS